MTVDYSDQTNFFDPTEFAWPIHLIGCGGIGSALALPLMKLGISELHVWDHDQVEPHNIPAQLPYRQRSDRSAFKVDALQGIAEWLEVDCRVVTHQAFVDEGTVFESGIVISGVDSMASRKKIWEAIRAQFWDIPFYMDGRIGGEEAQLYTLNPSDPDAVEQYEATLFSDEEASPLPCGGRTNIYTPTILAGFILQQLALWSRSSKEVKRTTLFHGETMSLFAF